MISGNYAASMALILRTLAQPGQHMWMEDPGYPFIRPVVSAAGVNIDPVPIDQQGMDIDWAQAHFPQARFALLTPAHQRPARRGPIAGEAPPGTAVGGAAR